MTVRTRARKLGPVLAAFGVTVLIGATPVTTMSESTAVTKTRLVKTACCQVQAPSYLKFATTDNQSTATYRGLKVQFGTEFYTEPHDLIGGTIDSLGGGNVTYTKDGKNFVVQSGVLYDDETIFYVRANYTPKCRDIGVLTITYPVTAKATFASVVNTLSTTFVSKNCP